MELHTPESIIKGHSGSRAGWAVGGVVGYKLWKGKRHAPLQIFILSMYWRYLTAAASFYLVAWSVFAYNFTAGYTSPWADRVWGQGVHGVVPHAPFSAGFLELLPYHTILDNGGFRVMALAAHALVIYAALGVVYIRLCIASEFYIGWFFKPCRWLAVRIPNVGGFWLLLTPLLVFPVLIMAAYGLGLGS